MSHPHDAMSYNVRVDRELVDITLTSFDLLIVAVSDTVIINSEEDVCGARGI